MQYSRPLFIFIVTIIYMCLYSSSVILTEYQIIKLYDEVSLKNLYIENFLFITESFIRAFAIIYLLTFNRIILAIFLPLLLVLSAFTSYFVYFFKLRINMQTIGVLLETTPDEASSMITPYLIFWCILAVVISIIIVVIFYKKDNPFMDRKRNQAGIFVCFIFLFMTITFDRKTKSKEHMPINFIKSTSKYFYSKINKEARQDISLYPASTESSNMVVVLFIGESGRSTNFSLNGYQRETNPQLKKVNNLLSFPNFESCANLTSISVPCLLTRAKSTNLEASSKETSLVSIFEKLNFKTFWIDNQNNKRSFIDSDIVDILAESNFILSTEDRKNYIADAKVLPVYENIIDKNPGDNILIIIHARGSHWHYDNAYDHKTHMKWKPTCRTSKTVKANLGKNTCTGPSCNQVYAMASCPQNALINSYDNTILYTDYVLSQVIKKLENKKALFFYTSDHGESLGEDNFYLHGQMYSENKRVEQYHVPFLVWGSEKYISNNQENFDNIRQTKDLKTSHDNIFHSILGCSNVESELIDQSLNLCSSTK